MVTIQAFAFNTVQENTYLLHDETGEAAIIDCGAMSQGEYDRLTGYCQQHGLTPRLLLNTHLHFDHCWGNPWAIQQWPDLKAYCHPYELTHQPKPSEQFARFGLMLRFDDLPAEAYHPLAQGDVLRVGNTTLEVRFVPGHSPGHVVFYCPRGRFVIAGDTLFYEDIGRTDLWGGNYDQLISGIKRELLSLPEETYVYTGHGEGTTIAHERDHNPYLR